MCVTQNLHKWRRLERSGQGWRHHHPINSQQCSESLRDETITSFGNNHQRPQYSSILACSTGHSCVPGIVLGWFDLGFLTTAVRSR